MVKLSLAAAVLASSLATAWARGGGSSFKDDYEEFLRNGREGKITIYRESYWGRDSEKTKAQWVVPQDTCMSANFTLDSNVVINSIGVCPGGQNPYVALYALNDCTGAHAHPRWSFALPRQLSKAVWGAFLTEAEPPVGHWSMILRCLDREAAAEAQGAKDLIHITLPLPPPPPPPKKPKKPSKTAAVSDSACFTKKFRMPTFLFKHPRPDVCLNIEPGRQLRIYHTAMCDDGSMARFARFDNKGCSGEPKTVEEVDEKLLSVYPKEPCIKFSEEEWSSYSFICSGDTHVEEVKNELFPDKQEEGQIRIHYSNMNMNMNTNRNRNTSSGSAGAKITAAVVILGILVVSLALYMFGGRIVRGCKWLIGLVTGRDEGRIAL